MSDTSNEAGHCVRTAYGNIRLANLKISQIIKGRVKRERYRRESRQEYRPYQCKKCAGLWHIEKIGDGRIAPDPVNIAKARVTRAATVAAKKAQNALQGPQKRRTGHLGGPH